MATLAKLLVELGLDPQGFEKGLDRATDRLRKTGGAFRKVGLGFSAAFTAPALLAGKSLLGVATDFDAMQDTIRIGTGATGQELGAMGQMALAVFKSIPTTMDQVGTAMVAVQQITGATGRDLMDLTKTNLELARVTGTDLQGNIASTSKAFQQWGVATGDQVGKLDALFRATQATGVPVATLADQLAQYGPILRGMGFDIDASIALLGTLGKAGLDAGQVVSGMRFAFAKFADEGVTDVKAALQDVFTRIKNAPSDLEASQLALETFGTRAGPALADSIRQGRLGYEDLLDVVKNGGETVLGAAADTNDLAENWQIFKNRLTAAVLPVATKLFALLNQEGIPALSRLADRVEGLVAWFDRLSPTAKLVIGVFAGILAAAGPVLIVLGTLVGAIGPAIGVIGAVVGAISLPLLLIIGLVALLAVAWAKNWFDIRGKTQAAVEFIGTWLFKIWDYLAPVRKFVGDFADYLSDVLTHRIEPGNLERFPKVLRPLVFLFGRLAKTVRVLFLALKQGGPMAMLDALGAQIRAFGRAFAGLITQITGSKRLGRDVKAIFDAVSEVIAGFVALADDLINGRWKQALGDLVTILKATARLALAQWRYIADVVVWAFQNIPWGTIGSALWAGFKAALDFLATTGLPWAFAKGGELLGALWDGMTAFWDETLQPWLLELPGLILDAIGDLTELLLDKGSDLLSGIYAGAKDYWDTTLWPWLRDLPGSIGDAFTGAAAGVFNAVFNAFWSVGRAIPSGIWSGVQSLWAWLKGQLDAFWNSIPDFAKKAWQVFSPSRVFADIGENAMLGLAKGFADNAGMLRTKVGVAVDSAIPTMAVGAPRLSAMPAVASAGGAGNRTIVFEQGAIVVNEATNGERIAADIMRAVRRRQAGLA